MMIENTKSPKILVIGDLIIDQYLWGNCERISAEAPIQIIDVKEQSTVLGGAGNVVNNLVSLGANTDVISVIGKNESSSELLNLFKEIKVDSKYLVIQEDRLISKKSRIISAHQQVVRFDLETTSDISRNSEDSIIKIYQDIIKNYDVILLSDYGKGVLTSTVIKSILKIAKKSKKKVLIDPKGKDYSKYKGAFLITPNKKEASEATNIPIVDKNSLTKAILKLKNDLDLRIAIITLSEDGVAIFDNSLRVHPTQTKEVFDVTGAGDTILASLGFALASDIKIDDAVEFSNLAAGVVVGKIGSATATLKEISEYKSSQTFTTGDSNIKTITQICSIAKELKLNNKKIIFTNGCFDILHLGHVKYLEAAKKFGDILIVGLNSDESVKALKGKNRPINPHKDRAYILSALEVVDYVVIFDEKTPYNLIKSIMPHTLVKGSDYKSEEIVGKDLASETKLVNIVNGRSTSSTIKKIRDTQ